MDKQNNTTERVEVHPDIGESDTRRKLEALRRDARQRFKQIERGQYTEYAFGKEVADKIIAAGLKSIAERKRY